MAGGEVAPSLANRLRLRSRAAARVKRQAHPAVSIPADGAQVMPDCLTQPEPGIHAACADMHDRLIAWGRIIIVGGKGDRQKWDSDSTRQHFEFTPTQHDAAWRLHIMVGQLPEVRHRFVLPAFYRHIEADVWDGLTPQRQLQIIRDRMAAEVNENLRGFTLATGQWLPRVDEWTFEGIRLRAIRMLVNREAAVPETQQSARSAGMGLAKRVG